MSTHMDDPIFVKKKSYYEKIVDDLENKNFSYLFEYFINKNMNNTIVSTNDYSHNNLSIIHSIKSDVNNSKTIQEEKVAFYSLNKSNNLNTTNENIDLNIFKKNNDIKEKEEDEINDECNDEKSLNFYEIDKFLKSKNSLNNKNKYIYENNNNDNNNIDEDFENENNKNDSDEKSEYCLKEIKDEKTNNYLLLDEIM